MEADIRQPKNNTKRHKREAWSKSGSDWSGSSSSSSSSDSENAVKSKPKSMIQSVPDNRKLKKKERSQSSSDSSVSSNESDDLKRKERKEGKEELKRENVKSSTDKENGKHNERKYAVKESGGNLIKQESGDNESEEERHSRNKRRKHLPREEDNRRYPKHDRRHQLQSREHHHDRYYSDPDVGGHRHKGDERRSREHDSRYKPDYRERRRSRSYERHYGDHQERISDHRKRRDREDSREGRRNEDRYASNYKRNRDMQGNQPREDIDNWAADTQTESVQTKKEEPNFGLSGKLTEFTNTYKGVVIKYNEPPEARKPRTRWRLYPFKGEESLAMLHIHRQSAYLIGRDRMIADIPVDHPSCSKQHSILQFRLVDHQRPDGDIGKKVKPYIIDLESTNGTYVNNKRIDPRRYVELLEKDVLKFGFSTREYVILHEKSKGDESDLEDEKVEEAAKDD